ncbi:hypothetical protein FHR25_004809 [Yokenella regensburgei]|nr:hypothetical protein FHR25_004809 [Yokenella regensburgei]
MPDSHRFSFWFAYIERGQSCRIGVTFIDSHHLRLTVMTNGFAKEAQGSGCIPFCGQQKVNGLSCSIDRTI